MILLTGDWSTPFLINDTDFSPQNGNVFYIDNHTFGYGRSFILGLNSFETITVYVTKLSSWISYDTINTPSPRSLYTTVLTKDSLIIVYGGINSQGLPVPDPILIFNALALEWSRPTNINTPPSSVPFRGHTATLVGNYMVIAFGLFYNNGVVVQSNQIHMIDVSDVNNFKWVKNFTPSSISETANNANGASGAAPQTIEILGGTI
ncbi:hypothetical protein RclHR1_10600002 [Rhizophagus clarus]|uniref:Galactose oxidase n=1 Tax=Rhizophagus clarus TaxID=94130 RepID=A0A2Z6Q373_9GLOM|nr:hypothetical protein RclHR1_10600002 [Rhizophagus clarus]